MGVSPPPIVRLPPNATHRAQSVHAQASIAGERAVQAKQCAQCTPSESCRNAVYDWAQHNGRGFPASALGLKRLSVELDELLRCRSPSEEVLIIDVGAGIHNLGAEWIFNVRSLHDDDSDALWLLGSFGPWARIHAFEANKPKAVELQKAARLRRRTASFSEQFVVHNVGVGGENRVGHLARCTNYPNAWSITGNAGTATSRDCKKGHEINVTTLDDFVDGLPGGVAAPLYIKIDVEGGEWDVLRGMRRLLSERRVAVASFEYAIGWHPAFKKRTISDADREDVTRSGATLQRFQRELSTFGYDTYLVNAGKRNSGVVLVPVYGDFWRDELEICFNRTRWYTERCWNDLIVVRRCDTCVKEVLFGDTLRRTHETFGRAKEWKPPLLPGGGVCECL